MSVVSKEEMMHGLLMTISSMFEDFANAIKDGRDFSITVDRQMSDHDIELSRFRYVKPSGASYTIHIQPEVAK